MAYIQLLEELQDEELISQKRPAPIAIPKTQVPKLSLISISKGPSIIPAARTKISTVVPKIGTVPKMAAPLKMAAPKTTTLVFPAAGVSVTTPPAAEPKVPVPGIRPPTVSPKVAVKVPTVSPKAAAKVPTISPKPIISDMLVIEPTTTPEVPAVTPKVSVLLPKVLPKKASPKVPIIPSAEIIRPIAAQSKIARPELPLTVRISPEAEISLELESPILKIKEITDIVEVPAAGEIILEKLNTLNTSETIVSNLPELGIEEDIVVIPEAALITAPPQPVVIEKDLEPALPEKTSILDDVKKSVVTTTTILAATFQTGKEFPPIGSSMVTSPPKISNVPRVEALPSPPKVVTPSVSEQSIAEKPVLKVSPPKKILPILPPIITEKREIIPKTEVEIKQLSRLGPIRRQIIQKIPVESLPPPTVQPKREVLPLPTIKSPITSVPKMTFKKIIPSQENERIKKIVDDIDMDKLTVQSRTGGYTVNELKEIADALGLKKSGKKEELRDRILEFITNF